MTKEELFKIFGTILTEYSFIKKKPAIWIKENKDTDIIFELQKSRWSLKYYVNIGIFYKDEDLSGYPRPEESHLYFRLDMLIKDETNENLEAYFDLENSINEEERSNDIYKVIKKLSLILPHFETKEKTLKLIEKYPTLKIGFNTKTYKALGLSLPIKDVHYCSTVTEVSPDGTNRLSSIQNHYGKWVKFNKFTDKTIKEWFPDGLESYFIKIDGEWVKLEEYKKYI